jgi:hypothetical protein
MDQDEMMLSAMVGIGDTTVRPKIPLADQQSYLDKYISTVSVEDRRQIATIIYASGYRESLRFCSEGIVVDLSSLPDDVVRKMYDLLEHIRGKQSTHNSDAIDDSL